VSAGRAGLFLDLDGTLADSLPALRSAYHGWLAGFGRQGSDEEFEACNGLPLPEVVRTLRAAHGLEGEPSALGHAFLRQVARAHAASPPRPGARGLLETARTRGLAVALVTSAPAEAARRWLAGHDLAELVDHVVGAGDAARGKPAPDPYRRALGLCGCAAPVSLAVEDSRTGVLSAVAAGLPTLVVAPRAPGPEPLAALDGAVGVVSDLGDVAERLAP